MEDLLNNLKKPADRRSFMKRGLAAAGTATVAGGLLANGVKILGQTNGPKITPGDAAILRFLAAAEIIESDLWQQYAELGGVNNTSGNPYQLALENLDGDGPQYITSNTLDEVSHANFLNAYLASKGVPQVSLSRFRTLPSSQATGAKQVGRLTNLMQLTVDTSWYVRYRSRQNPDFGATFPQAFTIEGKPAIPATDADFGPQDHIQAIADTAAFHFGTIEQGGSSLYSAMAQKASSVEVLRIVVSIGGDEVAHFLEWVDFAGNGASDPLAPLTDPVTGLTIPDLNASGSPLTQTNLIFPVPCEFIDASLPKCAVIRPTEPDGIAAGVVQFLTDMGLFIGQTPEFFDTLNTLAAAADAAQRGM
ncbi:MAG TPA: ferritin-like domain-containing protein [Terriglobia bacterium]|nr:ferritin-like domain-containing protein [Terriglobia bacterium]